MTEFVIGLDSWVLQDGNYTDFKTGETRSFALEMGYTENLKATHSNELPRCVSLGDCLYEVIGDVTHVAALDEYQATLLDLGSVCAYTYYLKPPSVGDRLAGQISLGVDPFFYFDEIAKQPSVPPMIYTWQIDKIELDVTPMKLTKPGDAAFPKRPMHPGTVILTPDRGREAWRTIDKTRMWKDKPETADGYPTIAGGYRIHCTLVPDPPTHGL